MWREEGGARAEGYGVVRSVHGLLPVHRLAQRAPQRRGPVAQVADAEARGRAARVRGGGRRLGAAVERLGLGRALVGALGGVHLE